MKKYIKPLIAASLTLVLIGCFINKTPTAAELLSQTYDAKKNTTLYTNVEVIMDMDICVAMSKHDNTMSPEMKTATTISLDTNLNVTDDGYIQYLDGTVEANIFGHETTIPTQNYIVTNNDFATIYEYDFDTTKWLKSESEIVNSPYIDFVSFFHLMNQETITDYKLLEQNAKESTYTVTGFIDMKDLLSILNETDIFEDTFTSDANTITDEVAYVSIIFDKKTLNPQSYHIEFDRNIHKTASEISKFHITLNINEFKNIKEPVIVLPQDIVNK